MAEGLLQMRSTPYFSELSPEGQAQRRQDLLDATRGATYAPFDLLGAPVDIANILLAPVTKPMGLYTDEPLLGSQSLMRGYDFLTPDSSLGEFQYPNNSMPELAGRVGGGFISPSVFITALDKVKNVPNLIKKIKDSKKIREDAAKTNDVAKIAEADAVASVLESDAVPLISIINKAKESGYETRFVTTDDGNYLTVTPMGFDRQASAKTVETARKRINAGKGISDEGSKLTKAEIDYILTSSDLNTAHKLADEISMSVNGKPYIYELSMGEGGFGNRISSVAKQAAIGRAFELATVGSPEYKSSVFSAYGAKYPSLLEAINAKNYDDLLEKSYMQMGAETEMQFGKMPIGTTYHRGDLDYLTSAGGTNSIAMLRDVIQNQNLNVFRGGDPHDFLYRVDPETGLNLNEKFRAVHDYFGHGVRGNKFDATGEEMAYGSHSQMYSPLARMAMAAETRGQNSFVNYTPLNIGIERKIQDLTSDLANAKNQSEKDAISSQLADLQMQREYAPQKSLLLPPEMLETSYQGGIPEYLLAANQPRSGTTVDNVPLYHASQKQGLLEIDPSYVGSRMGDSYGRKEASSISAYERPDRSYFFADNYRVGDPATKGDPFVYQGSASGLYDVMDDPMGLLDLARFKNEGVIDRNLFYKDFEQGIKDYGYSGYLAPFGGGKAAQMFYPTEVQGLLR